MRPLLIFLFTAVALGQSGGTIAGTVFDLSGNGVAKAPIQATNVATKAVYKIASSDRGSYRLESLPAGTYEVAVATPGYNPYTEPGVTVSAGQALNLDIHLLDFQLGTLGDGVEFRIDQLTPHATAAFTPNTRAFCARSMTASPQHA